MEWFSPQQTYAYLYVIRVNDSVTFLICCFLLHQKIFPRIIGVYCAVYTFWNTSLSPFLNAPSKSVCAWAMSIVVISIAQHSKFHDSVAVYRRCGCVNFMLVVIRYAFHSLWNFSFSQFQSEVPTLSLSLNSI